MFLTTSNWFTKNSRTQHTCFNVNSHSQINLSLKVGTWLEFFVHYWNYLIVVNFWNCNDIQLFFSVTIIIIPIMWCLGKYFPPVEHLFNENFNKLILMWNKEVFKFRSNLTEWFKKNNFKYHLISAIMSTSIHTLEKVLGWHNVYDFKDINQILAHICNQNKPNQKIKKFWENLRQAHLYCLTCK